MKPTDLTTDYWLHGLEIRSEIQLPEPRTAVDSPDLEILREPSTSIPDESPPGTPVADFEIHSRQWYVATAGDDGFIIRFPGIADFLIDAELSTIRCRPDPKTEEGLLPLLSSGTVLSFLLSLRGECVLHASAVEEGGRAIAVAGVSGAGKSTCAALLCASGARLVTDDVLRVKI